MSTTVEIPKPEWRGYFDRLTHQLDSASLSIEVLDDAWPPALEIDGLALQFMAYDDRNDLFEVAGRLQVPVPETFHHTFPAPRRVTVDTSSPGCTRLEVESADGARIEIRLEVLQ